MYEKASLNRQTSWFWEGKRGLSYTTRATVSYGLVQVEKYEESIYLTGLAIEHSSHSQSEIELNKLLPMICTTSRARAPIKLAN